MTLSVVFKILMVVWFLGIGLLLLRAARKKKAEGGDDPLAMMHSLMPLVILMIVGIAVFDALSKYFG